MIIEEYSFGQMTISGEHYSKDLIILPDSTIIHPWWRKTGHNLTLDDLGPVIDASPSILVVGTGMSGLMELDVSLLSGLKARNIDLTAKPTAEAVEMYNSLVQTTSGVAACFHLTC